MPVGFSGTLSGHLNGYNWGGSCRTAFRAEPGQSTVSRPATIDRTGTERSGGLPTVGYYFLLLAKKRLANYGRVHLNGINRE